MALQFIDNQTQIDFLQVTTLLQEMRWCKGITLDEVVFAAKHSALALAAYQKNTLVGYLRVVSDRTCFAYIMDVVVTPALRGQGIGQAMIQHARSHTHFMHVYQWMLRTPDAQAFYAKQGFRSLVHPEQWMLIQDNRPKGRDEIDFNTL